MGISEDIERLAKLKESGAITDAEFIKMKESAIGATGISEKQVQQPKIGAETIPQPVKPGVNPTLALLIPFFLFVGVTPLAALVPAAVLVPLVYRYYSRIRPWREWALATQATYHPVIPPIEFYPLNAAFGLGMVALSYYLITVLIPNHDPAQVGLLASAGRALSGDSSGITNLGEIAIGERFLMKEQLVMPFKAISALGGIFGITVLMGSYARPGKIRRCGACSHDTLHKKTVIGTICERCN